MQFKAPDSVPLEKPSRWCDDAGRCWQRGKLSCAVNSGGVGVAGTSGRAIYLIELDTARLAVKDGLDNDCWDRVDYILNQAN
jgi:hypothetical protein